MLAPAPPETANVGAPGVPAVHDVAFPVKMIVVVEVCRTVDVDVKTIGTWFETCRFIGLVVAAFPE